MALSIVTPPSISILVIQNALSLGIKNIWLQPGAENESVISLLKANVSRCNFLVSGPCVLVELGFHDND